MRLYSSASRLKRESARSNCFDRADRVGEVAVGGFLPEALVARFVDPTIERQDELTMNRSLVFGFWFLVFRVPFAVPIVAYPGVETPG
jgi:hypothetical protein